MSSHHFVKEGQEPVLIVANGELCSYNLLVSILEWSPTIIALDGAYHKLMANEIVPDVLIGDMDSVDYQSITNIKVVKIDEQESTDLEKGINYAIENGYSEINIIGFSGKRLDHTVNNLMSIAKYNCQITLYDDHSKVILLQEKYAKHYSKGEKISLIPLPRAGGISTSNLLFELMNDTLELGSQSGTSNEVVSDGVVTVEYQSGKLVLVESRDEI